MVSVKQMIKVFWYSLEIGLFLIEELFSAKIKGAYWKKDPILLPYKFFP